MACRSPTRSGWSGRSTSIVGVVTNGLFRPRGADLLLLLADSPDGVQTFRALKQFRHMQPL
jgi:hypothetical protein